MFRTNSAKQKRLFPNHNPYTISACSDCSLTVGVKLAYNPNSELCQSCRIIVACAESRKNDQKKSLDRLKNEIKDRAKLGFIRSKSLQTKGMRISKNTLSDYFAHAWTVEKIGLIECVINNPDKLKPATLNEALGARKDMSIAKNVNNVKKKKDRGVTHYNWYEFTTDKTYLVGFECVNKKIEKPYSVKIKK